MGVFFPDSTQIVFDLTLPLQVLSKLLIPFGLVYYATDFTNVQYQNSDGVTLHAYLATPPNFNAAEQYPAAIVYHAFNGMDLEPTYFADLLAEQGYIAIAPDLFRNLAAPVLNLPWNILTVLLTPQDRVDADVDAALDYLTNEVGNVDTSLIVSGPGFCYGGSQALELSTRRPVAATVTLYGGSNIAQFQDPNNDGSFGLLGIDGTPVLGIYGSEDTGPTPSDVRGFQAAMDARGITNTVTIYDGVGHAFVNPDDHTNNQNQAVLAWDQVVEFMNNVKNGIGVSRRAVQLGAKPRTNSRGPSFAWIFDHAMDWFQGKGHFSHRHIQNNKYQLNGDIAMPRITFSEGVHEGGHEIESTLELKKDLRKRSHMHTH